MMKRALFRRHLPAGFTLVEVIVVSLIVALMAALTTGIVVSLIQMFVYLPREMKVRTVAQEVIDSMIEGEPAKRGMRYAVRIEDASAAQFTYTFGYPGNGDRRNMRFQLSNGGIYRSYTSFGDPASGPQGPYSAAEAIPYYGAGEVTMTGPSGTQGTIFTYFKADGSAWVAGTDTLTDIRRVEINLIAKTGSGAFGSGQGSFQTTAGVAIKQ